MAGVQMSRMSAFSPPTLQSGASRPLPARPAVPRLPPRAPWAAPPVLFSQFSWPGRGFGWTAPEKAAETVGYGRRRLV